MIKILDWCLSIEKQMFTKIHSKRVWCSVQVEGSNVVEHLDKFNIPKELEEEEENTKKDENVPVINQTLELPSFILQTEPRLPTWFYSDFQHYSKMT